MPKYLITATYTSEGAKGLLWDSGTKRREAAEQAIKSVGGTMDSFYFAFGGVDAYITVDAPDHATVAAASVAINASAAVRAETVVLLTAEEIDRAIKKNVTYRAPGNQSPGDPSVKA
jgi:uncharacterized protein with GYD domain